MIVIGHRGVHGRTCSENTLGAFHEAMRQGADGIEFDLRISKDGELVVVHDANLHRVAGDAHRVIELSAAELSRVPLRHGGNIPTLQEITTHVHAPAIFDMEIKHRDAIAPLITKLKTSTGLRERTIISSFHASVLLRVRREVTDVRTLFLMMRWPLPLQGQRFWRRIERLRPWGVAFPLPVLNRRRIAHLRRLGLHVGTWDRRGTVREAQKARALDVDLAIVRHVKEAKIPRFVDGGS